MNAGDVALVKGNDLFSALKSGQKQLNDQSVIVVGDTWDAERLGTLPDCGCTAGAPACSVGVIPAREHKIQACTTQCLQFRMLCLTHGCSGYFVTQELSCSFPYCIVISDKPHFANHGDNVCHVQLLIAPVLVLPQILRLVDNGLTHGHYLIYVITTPADFAASLHWETPLRTPRPKKW